MTRSLTFGRGPGADVTVEDDYCSAVHCRIEQRGNRCWVGDLGSTNGTYIMRPGLSGGIRVYEPTPLLPGDKVRIGRTTLPWEAQ